MESLFFMHPLSFLTVICSFVNQIVFPSSTSYLFFLSSLTLLLVLARSSPSMVVFLVWARETRRCSFGISAHTHIQKCLNAWQHAVLCAPRVCACVCDGVYEESRCPAVEPTAFLSSSSISLSCLTSAAPWSQPWNLFCTSSFHNTSKQNEEMYTPRPSLTSFLLLYNNVNGP